MIRYLTLLCLGKKAQATQKKKKKLEEVTFSRIVFLAAAAVEAFPVDRDEIEPQRVSPTGKPANEDTGQ